MLCFGHDWSGDPLSKTHIMRILARDNRILWINSIGYRAPTASARDAKRAWNKLKQAANPLKKVEHNLWTLSPIAIPAYGMPSVQRVNRELLRFQIKRAMRKLGMKRPINWVFNPTGSVVAGSLGEDKVVYYCVDEFTAFSGISSQLVEIERKLLEKADVVFVSSEKLRASKSKVNDRTILVRHGVDFAHFQRALDPATKIPDDVAKLPKPIIGYFGLMADDWIDIPLMAAVAKHFSHGSMVLLGKVTTDISALTSLPNVHVLGRKPFADLPGYSKAFDVAINPFPINETTLNANPLKVREYLAAGLPVVSSRIPEVEVLGDLVHIADDSAGFIGAIEKCLEDPGPKPARSESMKNESWEGKVEEIRRHMSQVGS